MVASSVAGPGLASYNITATVELTTGRFGELGIYRNLVLRQTRGGFHSTAEIEKRNQGRDFPDSFIAPTGIAQFFRVIAIDESG